MMLEGKPQGNTDLKRTSQGWDILRSKTGIQQDFRKADLDLTTVVVSFPRKYFLAKQDKKSERMSLPQQCFETEACGCSGGLLT